MSTKIDVNMPAPDFSLADLNGKVFHLADYRGRKHLFLVFNRGFV